MGRMGLRTKLAIGFALLLAMLVALGGTAYLSIQKVTAAVEEANVSVKKKEIITQIEMGLRKQIQSANDYVFNGYENSLQRYGKAKQQAQDTLDQLSKLLVTAKGKEMLGNLDQTSKKISALTGQEIDFRRQSRSYEATDLAFGPKEEQAIKEMAELADQFEAREDGRELDAIHAEHETEAKANLITWIVVGCGFFIGTVAAILIARSITGGIKRMLRMIEGIAANDLTLADIPLSSSDEIGKAEAALNTMKNNLANLIHSISAAAKGVDATSEHMSEISQQITTASEETSTQASVVSDAVQQVGSNLQTVATGSGEMTATIQNIATNAQEAANFAAEAVKTAQAADTTITKLGSSSAEISEVVKVINAIAQQTNLLALNATIEAARAGEAGKGFAVVANEVKELAKQSAKATEDIGNKITAIQQDSKEAVGAIGSIHVVVHKISGISATIASSVEEQSATTHEMSRNINEAASGAIAISDNVKEVAKAAQQGAATAQESQKAAEQLAEMSRQLNSLIAQFKINSNSNETEAGLENKIEDEVEKPRSRAAAAGSN